MIHWCGINTEKCSPHCSCSPDISGLRNIIFTFPSDLQIIWTRYWYCRRQLLFPFFVEINCRCSCVVTQMVFCCYTSYERLFVLFCFIFFYYYFLTVLCFRSPSDGVEVITVTFVQGTFCGSYAYRSSTLVEPMFRFSEFLGIWFPEVTIESTRTVMLVCF